MKANEIIDQLLQDLESSRLVLPTLPEVALRVRDAVDDPNASLDRITRIIVTDAALSARLIQIANSPLMRASRKIETIDMAVNWLGLKLVREMVMSMVMEQMFQATSELTDRKFRETWHHSTLVAAISHALALQYTRLSPEQAMLGGLVHDIGVLPILKKVEDYPQLLNDEVALDTIIEELHGRIGHAILDAWHFPEELIAVPLGHEDLQREVPDVDIVDVVMVANLQSHIDTNHRLTRINWQEIPAFDRLGMSPELNLIEMEGTAEDIEETQRLLS